jgi:tetratricopeptide (TPR) repeat protein
VKAALEETRRQFLLLGNYVKGIRLVADLMHSHPYDRHLHRTLGDTLLSLLKTRPAPWLPDFATFPFPADLLARLRTVSPQPPQARVGEVLCLLVTPEDSPPEGFIRLLRCKSVGLDRFREFSEGIGPQMQAALRGAKETALTYLADKYAFSPQTESASLYAYEIIGDPPHLKQEFDGRSIAAAAALATLSLATQTPVPVHVAVTGALDGMEIKRVEEVTAKVETLLRERPYVTQIFVPPDNEDDLPASLKVECVRKFDELVQKIFPSQLATRLRREVIDFGKTIQSAQEEYDTHRNYPQALRQFRAVLSRLPKSPQYDYYRCVCLWRMQSIATHRGDVIRVEKSLPATVTLADALWREGDLRSYECLNIHVTYAVHLTDLYRYRAVEEELIANPVVVAGRSEDKRTEVKRFGTLGQLYLFRRRFPKAEEAFLEALRLLGELPPDTPQGTHRDHPRQHTYLMRLYTEMRNFTEAVQHYKKAEKAIHQLKREGGPDDLFLRTYGSRLFYLQGDYQKGITDAEQAIGIAQENIYPACIARRHQGLAFLALGKEEEGQAILRAEKAPPDFSAVDWPSLNIRVIRDVSVIELALQLLHAGVDGEKELRPLLRHVLTGLKNFSLARPFFKSDITRLQHHLDAKKLTPPVLRKHLIALRDKILT